MSDEELDALMDQAVAYGDQFNRTVFTAHDMAEAWLAGHQAAREQALKALIEKTDKLLEEKRAKLLEKLAELPPIPLFDK